MAQLHVIVGDELRTFSGITSALDEALRQGGTPVKTDSGGNITHQYTTRQFAGGWLLDNCPLNVIFGQRWSAEQIDAAKAAGISPYCPECANDPGCMEAFFGGGGNGGGGNGEPTGEGCDFPPGSVAPFTDGSCPPQFTREVCADGYEYCAPPVQVVEPSEPTPTPATPAPTPAPTPTPTPGPGPIPGGGGGTPWFPSPAPAPAPAPNGGDGSGGLVILLIVLGIALSRRGS